MLIESERLLLSEFTKKDAPFFYELVNDPAWIEFIGERNVKTILDAEKYLTEKIIPSYQKLGFGFYIVRLKSKKTAIGMCGLVKRDWLDLVDIGYAFLPDFRGKGYAFEAGKATMNYAKETLDIQQLAAITAIHNKKSSSLLEKLGLSFNHLITYPNETEKVKLYTEKEPVSL